MKNNYPIKYALIPMMEQDDYNNDELVCYIVSKCYLVNEIKYYKQNGSTTTKYSVVCPYYQYNYDLWFKEEPRFNSNNNCTNSIITDSVYDTFDDAIKAKNKKNKLLLVDKISYLPFEQYIEKKEVIENNFYNKLSYYNQLENSIQSKTKELNTDFIPKQQMTIINENNQLREYDISLYNLISLFEHDNYIVYSLTPSDFNKLEHSKDDKIDKFNNNILLINNKNSKFIKVCLPNNEEKYIFDDRLINSINEKYIIPKKCNISIYTTENYQDIINSYQDVKKDDTIKLTKKL